MSFTIGTSRFFLVSKEYWFEHMTINKHLCMYSFYLSILTVIISILCGHGQLGDRDRES